MKSLLLRQGLEFYKKRHSQYPEEIEAVREFVKEQLRDAWGNPIKYQVANAGQVYILTSSGEDAELGTKDDVRYRSDTSEVVYSKRSEIPGILGTIAFLFLPLSYLFCLVVLSPWIFLRRVFQQVDKSSSRIYVLLMVLMAACPFTWLNLIPMAFGYRSLQKKNAFLASVLFLATNISILILSYFYFQRFRSA